ncbi:hypothetical protein HYD_6230 [Candidatus Hydrogenosomobacter endosymbioticus]|uniref:Uncharacterized protein n=1 Tax=Candidatus Hydrogenosomobacter endosymbioticus TaxID=2558174 RepID=A0ABM7V9N0_9PROT|nr:hypothetical protein HYD_6230 [Candidatus Hydrogenosomobacter endosymbioticus]
MARAKRAKMKIAVTQSRTVAGILKRLSPEVFSAKSLNNAETLFKTLEKLPTPDDDMPFPSSTLFVRATTIKLSQK